MCVRGSADHRDRMQTSWRQASGGRGAARTSLHCLLKSSCRCALLRSPPAGRTDRQGRLCRLGVLAWVCRGGDVNRRQDEQKVSVRTPVILLRLETRMCWVTCYHKDCYLLFGLDPLMASASLCHSVVATLADRAHCFYRQRRAWQCLHGAMPSTVRAMMCNRHNVPLSTTLPCPYAGRAARPVSGAAAAGRLLYRLPRRCHAGRCADLAPTLTAPCTFLYERGGGDASLPKATWQ